MGVCYPAYFRYPILSAGSVELAGAVIQGHLERECTKAVSLDQINKTVK